MACLLSCFQGAASLRADLINNWTGDTYTTGDWIDSVSSVHAAATGSPQPVANAFNTHSGVTMNGGYFIIPAGVATAGISNFTVVVIVKPNALGPFSANYFNAIPLLAFDIAGSGQVDWGMSCRGAAASDRM